MTPRRQYWQWHIVRDGTDSRYYCTYKVQNICILFLAEILRKKLQNQIKAALTFLCTNIYSVESFILLIYNEKCFKWTVDRIRYYFRSNQININQFVMKSAGVMMVGGNQARWSKRPGWQPPPPTRTSAPPQSRWWLAPWPLWPVPVELETNFREDWEVA